MVELGNIAEGFRASTGGSGVSRDVLNLSIVNIKEEKTLKNIQSYVRDDVALKARYENPPVFLNLQVLVVATHTSYTGALLMLSRAIRFFQFENVFTPDSVDPASITTNAPVNALDRLASFKLIFDLYSPSMEEVNHLWGTLGGKQYPFALYVMRMLDLKFQSVQSETELIVDVVRNIVHKSPVDIQ
jgi:Pvc16 N-terminal domain